MRTAVAACLACLMPQESAPMGKAKPPEDEEERKAWIKREKAKGVRAFKAREASRGCREKGPVPHIPIRGDTRAVGFAGLWH